MAYCMLLFSFCSRLKWQKIRALQMFSEHVLLNHGNLVVYARRLNLVSREYQCYMYILETCVALLYSNASGFG